MFAVVLYVQHQHPNYPQPCFQDSSPWRKVADLDRQTSVLDSKFLGRFRFVVSSVLEVRLALPAPHVEGTSVAEAAVMCPIWLEHR